MCQEKLFVTIDSCLGMEKSDRGSSSQCFALALVPYFLFWPFFSVPKGRYENVVNMANVPKASHRMPELFMVNIYCAFNVLKI